MGCHYLAQAQRAVAVCVAHLAKGAGESTLELLHEAATPASGIVALMVSRRRRCLRKHGQQLCDSAYVKIE